MKSKEEKNFPDQHWLENQAPIVVLLTILFSLVLRRAWVSDDAYITFRTVDNFVNGYSLTWNAGERVQAYTHPLWMFFNSVFYFFTNEVFLTSIIVSMLVTAAAIILALRLSKGMFAAALGIIVLSLSNAFVDYSTSGLENPMTHLLLVLFLILFLDPDAEGAGAGLKKLFLLSFISSLALVNRMDSILFYIPALIYLFWQQPRKGKAFLVMLAGQLPFILWECFSILYYGFPFPNTAYAKLNTGIADSLIIQQGFYYLMNSLVRDPITLPAVLIGILASLTNRKPKDLMIAIGILLYIGYVIKIGGGFMSGRFLTAALFGAVILIMRLDYHRMSKTGSALIAGGLVCLGLIAPVPVWQLTGADDIPVVDQNGIADERIWYFNDMSLVNASRFEIMPKVLGRHTGIQARAEAEALNDLHITVRKNTGAFGYFAGPQVYVIDYLALSDPLLARLPAVYDVSWRIGHFVRIVPEGYISSVYAGESMLEDADLGAYYEQLLLITRGSLFSKERLAAIWGLNTGQFNELIDWNAYRFPDQVQVDLNDLYAGLNIGQSEEIVFEHSGVLINLEEIKYLSAIELTLESFTDYQFVFLRGELETDSVRVASSKNPQGFSYRLIQVPEKAAETGINRILILPINGDSNYFFDDLKLFPIEISD